jgi:hypothetical protein
MKLSDSSGSGETLLDKLSKSLRSSPGLPTNAVQQTSLGVSEIDNIYGSSEQFLSTYRQFEDTVFEMMKDSRKLVYGEKVADVDLMRKMGKIDLNVFNNETKSVLEAMLRDNVLKLDELISKTGIPGMEFPSENLYSTLTKFDVNQTERTNHAALSFLQRTFFNVNPNKQGTLAFNFGVGNLLTADALDRVAFQQSNEFEQLGKMMTLDVETTSVMRGSQVRSFADRVTDIDGKMVSESDVAFENLQMASTRVRTPDGNRRLMSEGVNILEKSKNVKSMENGGAEFIAETKNLFERIINPEIKHLSGHNIFFDLQKIAETAQGLDAYDSATKDLMESVFDRIANEKTFLIDTKETLSSYFGRKAQNLPDGAARVKRLLAPESLAKISVGGSTAPSSMENLVANSNVLELIEKNANAGDEDAIKLMKRIKSGSHIATTDVHMQDMMRRFELDESLDFMDMDKLDSASAFVKFGRQQYLRGGAFTATTNIADVAHLEKTGIDYLSGAGARNVMLENMSGSELGLSTSAKGQLRYNKSIGGFELSDTTSGSPTTFPVDETVARTHIASKLQNISNEANPNISIQNFNYLDATKVDEAVNAKKAVQGIIPTNDSTQIIRSLGLTDEQFGSKNSLGSMFRGIAGGTNGEQIRDIQPVLAFSDNVIKSYYQNAAKSGLGFSSLNIQDRVMSVKLAQATAGIGQMAAGTEKVATSMAHAKHAGLLGEMGLSYFNAQNVTRLVGEYDSSGPLPASKVMQQFDSLFEYGSTTAADGGIVRSLRVKAFQDADNILDTNLNRFTLSYISEADNTTGIGARINLVYGANKTLTKEQAMQHAEHMFGDVNQNFDAFSDITTMDRTTLAAVGAGSDPLERARITEALSEQIRNKGIVAGYVEGEPVEQMVRAFSTGGLDIVDNDISFLNHHMRLVHSENGVLTMSAMRNTQSDLAIGLSDEMAQREAEQVLNTANEVGELLQNNPAERKAAEDVVRKSRTSRALSQGEEVDFTKTIRSDIKTPMTDFYLKNKTKLGYAGIGLAAAGLGYYMSKKHRESNLYDETVKSQPTEPGSPRRAIQRNPASLSSPQSTRRDPLVTAGIVGNLDRNKIGHTQMGSNKYNHLYGG